MEFETQELIGLNGINDKWKVILQSIFANKDI